MSIDLHSPARSALGAGMLFLAMGCASSGMSSFPPDGAARPVAAVPALTPAAQLLPDSLPRVTGGAEPAASVRAGSSGTPGCAGALVDPTDGTRLRLVRSQAGTRGDYEVPSGRFGVRTDELLRVDCRTNRAIGIVPRRWRG